MCNVLEKMIDQVKNGFLWLNVFLPADLTILAGHLGIAIQTVLFFSFF